LARTVYMHRTLPYIWRFPCQKYRICTVYYRIYDDLPAKITVYAPYMTVHLTIYLPKIPYICTVYDRIFDNFPAINTVYMHRTLPYIWRFPCQNYRIYALLMTVYLKNSLPKLPYICTVYDRIFEKSPAKITVYLHRIWPYIWRFPCQNYRIYAPYMTVYLTISLPKLPYICTVYNRIFDDFPAINTVYMHRLWPYIWRFPCQYYRIYAPCIYGSGQPYT